jgi:hypothetical protein
VHSIYVKVNYCMLYLWTEMSVDTQCL